MQLSCHSFLVLVYLLQLEVDIHHLIGGELVDTVRTMTVFAYNGNQYPFLIITSQTGHRAPLHITTRVVGIGLDWYGDAPVGIVGDVDDRVVGELRNGIPEFLGGGHEVKQEF